MTSLQSRRFRRAVLGVTFAAGAVSVAASPSIGAQNSGAPGTFQIQNTSATTGYIGIHISENEATKLPIIVSVDPGSPAQKSGLQAGDTIVTLNGASAHQQFGRRAFKPGERLTFRLKRNKLRTVTLVVGERSMPVEMAIRLDSIVQSLPLFILGAMTKTELGAMTKTENESTSQGHGKLTFSMRTGFLGAEITVLNQELANALRTEARGVLILNVTPQTPAQKCGLQGGDIIIKADTILIRTVDNLTEAINRTADRQLVLEVVRKGKAQKRTVKW